MNFRAIYILPVLLLFLFQNETVTAQSSDHTNLEVSQKVKAEKVVSGIRIGWGIAFLPNGDMLVTEKSGKLIRIKDGKIVAEITDGIPADLQVNGQGGFLDIELHPDYEENGWIYFSYASNTGVNEGNNTAIIRARLKDNSLVDTQNIYKGTPNTTRGVHFGSRIVFDKKGYLYFSIGDRGNREVNPQDITRDGGKIYRLHDDGRVPDDNPFYDQADAVKATFSYGHRNPQGMAVHPVTDKVWAHEHGPRGGDELNLVEAGNNYGWPVISYGINYNGTSFAEDTVMQGMEQPVYYWDPSIAPSGMVFVNSDKYPDWKGDILVGSLKFNFISHLRMDGDTVAHEEKLVDGVGRIRALKTGPDGYIYFSAEGDGIYRLMPQ